MKNIVWILGVVVLLGVGIRVVAFRQNSKPETKSTQEVTSKPTLTDSFTNEQPVATGTTTMTPISAAKPKTYSTAPAMSIDQKKTYKATITTSKGAMRLTLFANDAPVAVNNFVFLAKEGFYNSTVFHRIIRGFMIQGGDPLGTGMGSPGYTFADEPITREYTWGTIAMANSGANTNGSQFFVMHADNGLPKNYVIFGTIDPKDTVSFVTLDAIAATPVAMSSSGEQSKPTETVTVQSVTIE